MKELIYRNEITCLLGVFTEHVKNNNSMGLFDINRVAEDFLKPILSILFYCKNLIKLDYVKWNYPAIDLGDKIKKISFQLFKSFYFRKF